MSDQSMFSLRMVLGMGTKFRGATGRSRGLRRLIARMASRMSDSAYAPFGQNDQPFTE